MTPERQRELQRAYLDTDYRVEGPNGRFAIRIGEPCSQVAELLDTTALDWAYVTACNPYSQLHTDGDNFIRMNHLVTDVSVAGYRFFPGEGAARNRTWKPEPSLLIVGISESRAIELARRYGQLAIVCGRAAEPARLVWIETDTTTADNNTRGTSP